MKRYTLLFFALLFLTTTNSQENLKAFKSGESLRYKMSYSGFLRAGTAVLEVNEKELNGKTVFYTKGTGWTSGMIKWFFEVDDVYESYFDKDSVKPYLFKRKIDEGGYKKHRITSFNYNSNKAYVQDFTIQKDTSVAFSNVQDILSSFYYLRNKDVSGMKVGEEIAIDMFLDSQVYPFKLRFLGTETLKTKFGKINTLIFRPLVQSGRVFKAQESVTLWITADANKIPIKIKADLAVGSLRAELETYKGLANPFVKN
ncbi:MULTISPECIES: DUF3108 domain-containing protein [unclassified Polaribacter]|jgi:hypothetical protein|uniref:DUF3108 domain-containing protein n=1 Tax=unclassified Polaribacter TaxID=196858 RepID=UPI001C4E66B2|nr:MULTISPECIES: DUF3108 domain-containing protein [unclassified Polaribacter]QXP66451.1 DUF3108 domain-containing protein [Polaribacter sp. AHE13PA]QXP71929.1 DUF3108 domain-containing protein [Polaribacter sp. R2A056_3_33]